jgi:hypothetical protein
MEPSPYCLLRHKQEISSRLECLREPPSSRTAKAGEGDVQDWIMRLVTQGYIPKALPRKTQRVLYRTHAPNRLRQ